MKLRVFLVDDEPLATRRLARMIAATGRCEIAGEATDPARALAAIPDASVDAVFLDISMPGRDGLEVARLLPANVMVIFTTAHDEHALRAFGVNAIDYLLKPVRDEDLARALDKLGRLRPADAAARDRIASRLGDKTQLLELARITHFVAEDKLTYAVVGGRSHVVAATIAELEDRYRDAGFVRVHRSAVVRLAAIAELHAAPDGMRVRLTDGTTELPVARDRVRMVKERLGLA